MAPYSGISSRRHISLISYFAMWALAIGVIIVGLATEKKSQLIVGPIILATWALFLIIFAAANIICVDSVDTLYISGYIVAIACTVSLCRWLFTIPDDQIVTYLPALVSLGIFNATAIKDFLHKPPPEREAIWKGLQEFVHTIMNLSLGDIFRGGTPSTTGYSRSSGSVNNINEVEDNYEQDIALNQYHDSI
ncbi:hypothetical protein F4810DRAFT_696890, partial [Camillea tinctor]